MKKPKLVKLLKSDKFEFLVSLFNQRSIRILVLAGFLYILLVTLEIPYVLKPESYTVSPDPLVRSEKLQSEQESEQRQAPFRPSKRLIEPLNRNLSILSQLRFDPTGEEASIGLLKSVKEAWELGRNLWREIESGKHRGVSQNPENQSDSCPTSISVSGSDLLKNRNLVELPCGLTLGSHITVVGKPRAATQKGGASPHPVSQFVVELQGLKTVEGEDPPRILHLNPRIKGDWSGKPVIEQNTCFRMHWGPAQRCQGWKSRRDEETVDGLVKCEKWIRDDDEHTEGFRALWWLNRLIGRRKKVKVEWPFPFSEDKLFVLTLSAGLEGYHVNVDGKHVTSFPYRTGFTLEDATGLAVYGDVDVHTVFSASLPTTHPSFAPQMHLEMSETWQAPLLPNQPVEMFIGILSAGNHFAERMAVRKSWMQHDLIRSSEVVARFFVALHARKEVNIELKKEAEYFGDIVIVPYMDSYDLVVVKTVAICEYGVHRLSAKYIAKCDDDTFVRVDAIVNEARKVAEGKSLYIGNINYYHRPLRKGKWAVTYEEWPEEAYPPYANGPGYILSSDIAHFIVNEFERHRLRLFKMEDVSVGMWVERFKNSTKPVVYRHSWKFCQFGCIQFYYTAHYQSPRQMICLWDKLQTEGKPSCCNLR